MMRRDLKGEAAEEAIKREASFKKQGNVWEPPNSTWASKDESCSILLPDIPEKKGRNWRHPTLLPWVYLFISTLKTPCNG
jgi:hypothetical protein